MSKFLLSHKFLFALIAGLVVAIFVLLNQEPRVERSPRVIIGRIEDAVLQDYDLSFKARIDSGAGLSSVNAKIIKIKEPTEAGKLGRVIFEISDAKGNKRRMDKEIIQWANIKHKGTVGFDKRPMVILDVCLGGKQIQGRVNLADRSQFLYPMLIGRNMLNAGDFLIDPAQTYMSHPHCKINKKLAEQTTIN